MTRNMRGDRASVRVARMVGSSVRRKPIPWRTAIPRSSMKARIWLMPASTWHRDQAMRVCGSGDVRRRRLPCRSDKAAYWQAAPPLGHATTFAAARWRRAHRGPRRGTSSCRYQCRSRRLRYWLSETWRAPRLWRPLPASLAGGAGARPDHRISGLQGERTGCAGMGAECCIRVTEFFLKFCMLKDILDSENIERISMKKLLLGTVGLAALG